MPAMDHLHVDTFDGWARLTLNRPNSRNALNTSLLSDVAATLIRLAADPTCRAVLLCGSEGNFAAGADIDEIEHKSSTEGVVDPRKAYWAAIRGFRKPLIAAVDGFALGGGLELALMADLLVVGPTARMGLPETSLGLVPGAGGGQRLLARIGPARAARMVLTGEIIDAATAVNWGLASFSSDGPAVELGADLARRLSQRAPRAMEAAKRALIEGAEDALAFVTERAEFEALLDSSDKAEGILAFREKRKPVFRGE